MLRKAIPVSIVVILAACVAALSGAVTANGGVTFTVDDTADALDADPGDGSCATTGGTCTLRAAVMETNALVGADTVILPSGTYTLTIGGTGEDMCTLGDLDITDDLTLSGAGPETTIIDGNGSVIFDRVLHVVDSDATAAISGVTIRNGGSASYSVGGILAEGDLAVSGSQIVHNAGNGLTCHSDLELTGSSVGNNTEDGVLGEGRTTVTNSTVDDNEGYGLRCYSVLELNGSTVGNNSKYGIRGDGSTTVNNSTVHDNGEYGVRTRYWGELVVTNSTIRDNGRLGVYSSRGPLVVENSTVSGNGGGLRSYRGAVTVVSSTVMDNTSGSGGGGIYGETLTVISSTICGNLAPYGGGIAAKRIEMTGCTVCSNTAVITDGGGILHFGESMHLTNSTISGNRASRSGGGIAIRHSPTLNNVTVTDNTASGEGGGLYVGLGNTLHVANSILAGNESSSSPALSPDCSGTLISQGYNLIQDTTGCFIGADTTGNVTGKDALLDPLADNGGPTLTHALLPGSPAIDAGNPAGCTDHLGGLLLTDQRGMPRAGRCDMGAYELERMALHFSRKAPSLPAAMPGDPLTYTIAIDNAGPREMSSVHVTDTLPALLTYVDTSLTASAGDYGFQNGVVTWTGSVSASGSVTVSYRAAVSDTVPLGTYIANTATISGGGELISRTATLYIGYSTHLPLVMRDGG
jgi:uncharacterized repeat protein (TIGR01451 family)